MENFTSIKIEDSLKHSLTKMNFIKPTPIQGMAIPVALEGKDILGTAQTGTGKTAAFLLPLMHRFLRAKEEKKNPSDEPSDQKTFDYFTKYQDREFALVLVPTRELAEQVLKAFEDFSQGLDLKACATYGGMDIEAVAEEDPAAIIKVPVPIDAGLSRETALKLAGDASLDVLFERDAVAFEDLPAALPSICGARAGAAGLCHRVVYS